MVSVLSHSAGKMEDNAEKTTYSGLLSQKVVAIVAGEAHTLALAGDGSVYSWGRETFGRLGTGKKNDELVPVRIEFDTSTKMKLCAEKSVLRERPKFVEIAAGAYHSLALEDDGSVWCWGYNVYLDRYLDGQLGLNVENSSVPCFLEQFLELGAPDKSNANSTTLLKVQSIKAGGMMSLAIDSLGALWMWGNCPQLSKISDGEFILSSHPTPSPVWDFHGHTVVKVACGNEHIIALVSAGETFTGNNLMYYSWGNNNHGQLGLGDMENRSRPAIVETFNLESPWEVYEVACGAFHTAVLTYKRTQRDVVDSSDLSIDGQEKISTCWTFGLGDHGQLGHGTTKSVCLPEPVKDLPQNVSLTAIDCGLFHTCVVSSAGDVWSWGMEKGLGLCPDASFTGSDTGDALSPLKYGSKFAKPVQVACGAAHTVLVSHDGYKLWSWGRGWSGVLGRGSMVDSYVPTVVMWPPLDEDFNESLDKESGKEKVGGQEVERATELEKSMSSAMEEVQLLRSKLNLMEKYASILHGSIFGKPFQEQDLPQSLLNTGVFDIAKEWENMVESAEDWKLSRLEMFYQRMLADVKDKQMKRKIQEMIRECLHYSNYGKPGTHVE